MSLAAFIASLAAQFADVRAALLVALAAVAAFLPQDEQAILFSALKTAQADVAAGKPVGEAVADAWTQFYQAEVSEANKVAQFLLGAILSALAPRG